MSAKRAKESQGGGDRRKKKYRSDGTPVWGKRFIDGPGVWVTCIKGKEKQAVGELYELFDNLASELWPAKIDEDDSEGDPDESLSIEAQIASEVSAMKRPRAEQRFANCQTNTPCLVFISCKAPVDPLQLVTTHVSNVQKTGVTQTRQILRLVPVVATCVANLPEIQALCRKVFEPVFGDAAVKKFKFKIELHIRNHTTITRPVLIDGIAKCVPEGHTVDLNDPELFILVEVFKSICGVSVVRDYYKLHKFNVVEIAQASEVGESINRM
ncbi:hypothetical protein C8J57DRAFT_1290659 [Mycena rebaudengoi]|nr:hypothetical protein C8J57DRAFT_1290659 [Mycena rebaudengoi]